MTRILGSLVLIFALLPQAASAQIETRHLNQLGAFGFGMVGGDVTTLTMGLSLTRFMTNRLEVGGDVSGTWADVGATTLYMMGRARYNFVGQSLWVPFASVGLGSQLVSTGVGNDSNMTGSVGVGFKRFLNESVSFNGEATGLAMENPMTGDIEFMDGVMLTFGISMYF